MTKIKSWDNNDNKLIDLSDKHLNESIQFSKYYLVIR